MNLEEKQQLLEEFLERWPESAVRSMTLSDYVGVEDKDTFTYWVETKMRPLGSIKGAYSTKFGIYQSDRNLK
jgi:5-methylcytosine-specific restriction protein B